MRAWFAAFCSFMESPPGGKLHVIGRRGFAAIYFHVRISKMQALAHGIPNCRTCREIPALLCVLSRRSETKGARMKFEGRRQVRREIPPIVAAGIEMEFVRDSAGCEHVVEGLRSLFEAVIVLLAAVEINLEAGQMRRARQGNRIISPPKGGIGWRAESGEEAQQA